MHADRNNQPVAEMDGLPDHIQVAVGDGIERAGIKRDALHGLLLYPPEQAGKQALYQAFYFVGSVMMKQNPDDMKPFLSFCEGIPKPTPAI